jgi:hypothetical protein
MFSVSVTAYFSMCQFLLEHVSFLACDLVASARDAIHTATACYLSYVTLQ